MTKPAKINDISPTSQSCRQDISSQTSVSNIGVKTKHAISYLEGLFAATLVLETKCVGDSSEILVTVLGVTNFLYRLLLA